MTPLKQGGGPWGRRVYTTLMTPYPASRLARIYPPASLYAISSGYRIRVSRDRAQSPGQVLHNTGIDIRFLPHGLELRDTCTPWHCAGAARQGKCAAHRRCGAGEQPCGHPSRVLCGELPGGSGIASPLLAHSGRQSTHQLSARPPSRLEQVVRRRKGRRLSGESVLLVARLLGASLS